MRLPSGPWWQLHRRGRIARGALEARRRGAPSGRRYRGALIHRGSHPHGFGLMATESQGRRNHHCPVSVRPSSQSRRRAMRQSPPRDAETCGIEQASLPLGWEGQDPWGRRMKSRRTGVRVGWICAACSGGCSPPRPYRSGRQRRRVGEGHRAGEGTGGFDSTGGRNHMASA